MERRAIARSLLGWRRSGLGNVVRRASRHGARLGRHSHRAALLATILFNSACASYKPPGSGEASATIRFLGQQTDVILAETPSCQARQSVPSDQWPDTRVRAGQRVWVEQSIGSGFVASYFGVPACGFAYSFRPEPGLTYVSEYSLKAPGCRLSLFRLTDAGEKVPEPSARSERPLHCAP